MLWSFGKDSNVMIHLARKAFFGRVPFPLVHCDTELEMDEVYAFRDRYVKEWDINFNKTLDKGGALLGDEVTITLEISAVLETEAAE